MHKLIKNCQPLLSKKFAQKPTQKKLGKIYLENIATPSQAFLSTAILQNLSGIGNVWFIANSPKRQDQIADELNTWGTDTNFLPQIDEIDELAELLPDPEILAQRLKIIDELNQKNAKTQNLILQAESINDQVPAPDYFNKKKIAIELKQKLDLDQLAKKLQNANYRKVSYVENRCEFSHRNQIFDVFSWQSEQPIRLDLTAGKVQAIRSFDIDLQISTGNLNKTSIFTGKQETLSQTCPITNYLQPNDAIIAFDLSPEQLELIIANQNLTQQRQILISAGLLPDSIKENLQKNNFQTLGGFSAFDNPVGTFSAGEFILQEQKANEFKQTVANWLADGWTVAMFFEAKGELQRFAELMPELLKKNGNQIQTFIGDISAGFSLPEFKLAVLADAEIFGRYQFNRSRRLDKLFLEKSRQKVQELGQTKNIADFNIGEIVVHSEHGIAIYRGVEEKPISADEPDNVKEFLILEFAKSAEIHVPVEKINLISKYIGVGKKTIKLSSLGEKKWQSQKEKAKNSIYDFAEKLIKIQAQRSIRKGIAHAPDSKWGQEFEQSFIYKETKDQLKAIRETKADMENQQPMDRLICGDVGFGKTEVAIRAAFKAVMGGYQVAFLAPTTVLANQHYQTLSERMSDFPIKIALLSRLRTAGQQKKTIEKLAEGEIDIAIGTHRLISKDIKFKNLGLAIVDEEQRFGVNHKERFKELFNMIDVLTLSATPIPRTLYLSMAGVRDMSQISTPPANRLAVKTRICQYSDKVIKEAIDKEIKRGGQVFFLHNRVKSIIKMMEKIQKLCPQAKVFFAHGQMQKSEMEEIMNKFIRGEIDVLVTTTIIESGVDIPNANTIIIDRADMFGLADLYQLRGRVGRAGVQAYAIMLMPPDMITDSDAQKRLSAIRQHNKLGDGFKIAMRDLEIRGAGNILGTEQSGNIMTIGFELYCQMLKHAVKKLKGERVVDLVNTPFYADFLVFHENSAKKADGKVHAFLPQEFIADGKLRMSAYRELAQCSSENEVSLVEHNWRDRFGKLPLPAQNLLLLSRIKILSAENGLESVEAKGDKLMLRKNGNYIQVAGKFPRLKKSSNQLKAVLDLLQNI